MTIINQWQESIPEYWLCYLINGETDNLTSEEIDQIHDFQSAMCEDTTDTIIYDHDSDQEPYFEYNYFIHLGCTCVLINVVQLR